MTKKQEAPKKVKYGIVMEPTRGQIYIMQPDPKCKGWAVEVAYYLKGPKSNPKNWELSKGDKYRVLLDCVDTEYSGFLEKLVSQIKINEKNKAGEEK